MPSRTSPRTSDPFDDGDYAYLNPSKPIPRYLDDDTSINDSNYSHTASGRRHGRHADEPLSDDDDNRGRPAKPRMSRRISRSADVGRVGAGEQRRRAGGGGAAGRSSRAQSPDQPFTRRRHSEERRDRDRDRDGYESDDHSRDWRHGRVHRPNREERDDDRHDDRYDDRDVREPPRHRSSRHPPPSAMPRNLGGREPPLSSVGSRRSSRHRGGFDADDDDDNDRDFDRPRRRHSVQHDSLDDQLGAPRRRRTHRDDDDEDHFSPPHRRHTHREDDDRDRERDRERDSRHRRPQPLRRSSSVDNYQSRRERSRSAKDDDHPRRGLDRGRERRRFHDDDLGHASRASSVAARGTSRARTMLTNVLWGAAAQAAVAAVLDQSKEPGSWRGEKGAKVASAAVTSACVDSFFHSRKPNLEGTVMHKATKTGVDKALGFAAAKAVAKAI